MNLPPFASTTAQAAAVSEPVPLWRPGEAAWIDPADRVAEDVDDRGEGFIDRFVSNVTVPTLTPHLPDPSGAARTAVLICPGGAYRGVALDKEGHDLARWLNSCGVAAFVLKYRSPSPDSGPHCRPYGPLRDAQRALRLIRSRSEDWSIAADRLGVMGFSAGGHLAASASTLFTDSDEADDELAAHSCRPDFSILVYPVISFTERAATHSGSRSNLLGPDPSEELMQHFSCERQVTADTPPAFLVQTGDDTVHVQNSILYYKALQNAGVAAELHLYAEGGHGYGMRAKNLPVTSWIQRCREWLETVTA